ncbi:MAG: sulfate transporter CysZ [Colwellia sp.]
MSLPLNNALKKPLHYSGASYFFSGFKLIQQKGIRRFVLIPLFINILFFSFAFYCVYLELSTYITNFMAWLPSWLDWLNVIIWPFAVLTILIIFSFVFSTVANWLAAPFNGLLSEKIEAILRGEESPKGDMLDIVKDIPRTLSREWQKLTYYLPRAIGFFILLWILPVFGQVIWFLFIAWMMAIQYKDYPFDNHKISFPQMKRVLTQNQRLSYSFGATVAVFSMIPIVNLIVMPVAICGATALWVDYYQDQTNT